MPLQACSTRVVGRVFFLNLVGLVMNLSRASLERKSIQVFRFMWIGVFGIEGNPLEAVVAQTGEWRVKLYYKYHS
jgi:hypothetical protein